MHYATKQFEIEILLKADLPNARAAEIARDSMRIAHRGRPETESPLRQRKPAR